MMGKSEIIITIIAFALSIFHLLISIFQFSGKGILINNAYLYASKKEKESMDKKPLYIQSGITFLLLSLVFSCVGIYILSGYMKLFLIIEFLLLLAILIYAIGSTIKMRERKKQ